MKIAGTEEETIYKMTDTLLHDRIEYNKMAQAANPYGDGLASRRTAEAILYYFGQGARPADFEA